MFRRGHIADHPQTVARRLGLHLHPDFGAMRAGTLPMAAATYRDNLPTSAGGPGILNQNDTDTCEGHAHAAGATLLFKNEDDALPEVLSPAGLALGAYLVDRGPPGSDGKLPDMLDVGTMPSSVLTAFAAWGAVGASAWGQYPVSSKSLYVDPSNPNSPVIPPPPDKLFLESSCRLKGAYFVQTVGLQKVLDILRALAAGKPVSIAIPASGQAFQSYTGGILGALAGPVDHANLLIGYAWTGTQAQFDAWQGGATGLDQYLVLVDQNSWGEGWGWSDVPGIAGGLCQVGRAFVDQLQDACVLDLVRTA